MAVTAFQLVDNQIFSPSDVIDARIFESPDQENGLGSDLSTGIRAIIDYHDMQSSPSGATLQAVVEGKSAGGQYYVLAYQFQEFNKIGQQQKRQLVMTPIMNWDFPGTDDVIWVGGTTVERVSNQVGTLPAIWRIAVILRDPAPPRFQSVRMSIYGERFNQLSLPDDFRGFLTDTEGTVVTEVT